MARIPVDAIAGQADAIYDQVRPSVAADMLKQYPTEHFDWSLGYVKDFITTRYASVQAQIAMYRNPPPPAARPTATLRRERRERAAAVAGGAGRGRGARAAHLRRRRRRRRHGVRDHRRRQPRSRPRRPVRRGGETTGCVGPDRRPDVYSVPAGGRRPGRLPHLPGARGMRWGTRRRRSFGADGDTAFATVAARAGAPMTFAVAVAPGIPYRWRSPTTAAPPPPTATS